MTAQVVTYTPADPNGVAAVTRLRLYTTSARTGVPAVDIGSAVQQTDGTWDFTIPDGTPDGIYYARTTVSYTDATVADDDTDTIVLPLSVARQLGDSIELWVEAAVIKAAVPGLSDAQAEAAAQTATDVLYALSGRQYPGARVATLRMGATITGGGRELLPGSIIPGGVLSSRRLGMGGGCCAVSFDPMLYPIRSVVRMSVGGVGIPAEQIEVTGRRSIRVIAGADSITDPLAVNYYLGPDGAYSLFPGSCSCGRANVELTMTWGREPPAGGLAAAELLAIEFGKALAGDQTCRLPGNVVSVSRQGVSVVLDPSALLDADRVGIPFVDTWLNSVNPRKRRGAPMLWSPEMPLPETVG